MSKVYIEGNNWGLTIGTLTNLSGEPFGIHFWKLIGEQKQTKHVFNYVLKKWLHFYKPRHSYEWKWIPFIKKHETYLPEPIDD